MSVVNWNPPANRNRTQTMVLINKYGCARPLCVSVVANLTLVRLAIMLISWFHEERDKVTLNNPLWPVKCRAELWRHARLLVLCISESLFAHMFVCDKEKTEITALLCTAVHPCVGRSDSKRLCSFSVHLQFRHVHKSRHDASAPFLPLEITSAKLLAHWPRVSIRLCVCVCVCVCVCCVNVYTCNLPEWI